MLMPLLKRNVQQDRIFNQLCPNGIEARLFLLKTNYIMTDVKIKKEKAVEHAD